MQAHDGQQFEPPHWERWSARFIASVFGVAMIVHVLTFVSFPSLHAVPMTWLVIATFLTVGMMVIDTLRRFGPAGATRPFDNLNVPPWADRLTSVVVGYAVINMMVTVGLAEGGAPAHTPTGYILENKGQIIRSLTEAEYWRMMGYQLRITTGHLMMFSGWPMIYFLFRPDSCSPVQRSGQAAA